MRITLKGFEAEDFLSRASFGNSNPTDDQIGEAKENDRAEDHDRTAPMQQHFVKIIPGPPGRLDQHTSFLVGDVDAPFDAGDLLEQVSFAGDARGWIGGTVRVELLPDRRAECRYAKEEHH